ncbi:MAG: DUF1294 domain-containing protein [Oscillospiraceae bacterium]|nr:DUF1294 domain-containing protein [Oscillospiraceae bacterium]
MEGSSVTRGLAAALTAYLAAINLAAFITFGADKRRAKRGVWRVPEKTLFLLALLGGSLGAVCGMCAFRHKTRHWYFKYGLPAILFAHIALILWLILISNQKV